MARTTKTIDGVTFAINTIPARKALNVSVRVAEVFGPLVANVIKDVGVAGFVRLLEAAQNKNADETEALKDLERLVTAAFHSIAGIKPEALDSVIDALAEVTVVESPVAMGGPLAKRFDEVFDDKLTLQIKWLVAAVVANYGPYFREAAQVVIAALKKAGATKASAGADPGTPADDMASVAAGDGEGRNPS